MNATYGVRWGLILGSLFCVGTAAAQPAAKGAGVSPANGNGSASSQASADAAAQARTLYEKGRLEAVAGNWQDAYATLRAAYAWFPHSQIAGGLGDAAFVLGKYPEAVEMLSQNLREATNLTAQERTDTEKRLAEAKKKCGTISIDAPNGAEVHIDGAPIGKLSMQKVLYVLPGAHTVEVVAPAGGVAGAGAAAGAAARAAATKQTVTMAAGGTARVTAQWGPAQAAGTEGAVGAARTGAANPSAGAKPPGEATGTAGTQPPAGETKPSLVPAIVLGAAAGLGLVAGGLLMGISAAKENEAAEKLTGVKDEPRPCRTAPCMRIDGLLAERDALGSAALGVWIGSASLAALAAGVYIVQRQTKTNAAMTWTPVVSTNGAGLVVRGAF